MEEGLAAPKSEELSFTLGRNRDTEGKYYYKADPVKHYYIKDSSEVDELYVDGSVPKLADLVKTCLQSGYTMTIEDGEGDDLVFSEKANMYIPNLFHKGDWVEYRGNDMKWDLELVTLVVMQAPDDWDYVKSKGEDPPLEDMEVFYNLGVKGLVPQAEVRAPRKGLQALFGGRPFLWQQHCLLQLERRIRFQKDHQDDFEEIDIQLFAETRFEEWLKAKGNEDFLEHYHSHSMVTQHLLRMHLFTPFVLMDDLIEDTERWDFEDKDITIYTYFGMMGSGCITVFLTVCIQVLALGVLIVSSTREYNGEPNERFFQEDGTVEGVHFFGLVPDTNFTTFCNNNGSIEGKILISVVLTMYFIQVIPNSWRQFFKISGSSDTTYSRINSLRRQVWEQNEDTIMQQIGYKLDHHMNIGFTTLVYWSMLFLLFNTPHPLDIILNALAIEFIHQFDERLADSEWWDPENRYIKAGTIEMVLRGTLDLNAFRSGRELCKAYDIDYLDYEAAVGSIDSVNLYNPILARRDDADVQYMSKNERLWAQFAQHARDTRNRRALETFYKFPTHYGTIEFFLYYFGLSDNGIFCRFISYRTWSRWEKLLFMPRIPEAPKMSELADESVFFDRRTWCGFGNEVAKRSYVTEFFLHVASVLTFREAFLSVASVIGYGRFLQVPWRIWDSLVEYVSYLLQILFPVYVLTGLSLVPSCY